MKKYVVVVFAIIILSSTVLAQQSKVFEFSVRINSDNTSSLNSFSLIEGISNAQPTGTGEYSIKIISNTGSILFDHKFDVSFVIHREGVDKNGNLYEEVVNLDYVDKIVRLPYFENADRIDLYRSNSLLLSQKIELCNRNNICEIDKGENFVSCPSDCKSGSSDNYCDKVLDGICDPDCSKDADIDCSCGDGICSERESPKTCPTDCSTGFKGSEVSQLPIQYPAIAGIVIILIIIGAVYFLKHSKKKKR